MNPRRKDAAVTWIRMGIAMVCCPSGYAQENSVSLQKSARLFGQALSIQQRALASQSPADGATQELGISSTLSMLKHKKDLVQFQLQPFNTAREGSQSDSGSVEAPVVKVAGVRLWNGFFQQQQGSFVYQGGIPPVQIRYPLAIYPIGPILLRVDSGVELEAAMLAKATPGFSIPIQDSSVQLEAQTHVYAAAYLEAHARLFVFRAGIGGRLDVVDAQVDYQARFALNGVSPQISAKGQAQVLAGQVYGFLDSKILFGPWRPLWRQNFYHHPGWLWVSK